MIKTLHYKDLVWHDLENPTPGEISNIIAEYSLPKEVSEEMLSPTPKQRVVEFPNCVYIVMHFPELRNPKNREHRKEIDFILGKKFMITVHYDNIHPIDTLKNSITDDFTIETKGADYNAGHIFHKLIKDLYHNLLHDVEVIKHALDSAENEIFKGHEKKMVVALSKVHRDILRFKNAIAPHREAIVSLFTIIRSFFGDTYEYFIHDMSSELQRVERRMQSNKDLLEELRDTNDSLLSSKQNEAIKGLTMMAFITFPLTLTAAIFSMDTKYMPIVGMQHDFWIIIGIMGFIGLACMAFLSYKKWL